MPDERTPESRWAFLDDVSWPRVLLGVGTVLGGLWLTVVSQEPRTPRPVLGIETEVRKDLRELELELRRRVGELEQYREEQRTFSKTRSAEIDGQIKQLRADVEWLRGLCEKIRDRLDGLIDERRRTP